MKSGLTLFRLAIGPFLCALVMCALLVFMLAGLLAYRWGILIIQALQLAILVGMLYIPFRHWGLEDMHALEGCMPGSGCILRRGAFAGLLLSLLLYGSVILLILIKIGVVPDMLYLYKLLNPQYAGLVHFWMPETSVHDVGWPRILGTALFPASIPCITGAAYHQGFHPDLF